MAFTKEVLRIEPRATVAKIQEAMRKQVFQQLNRRGVVVAVSGGVDSSVTLALAAGALGRNRVLALQLPEREADEENLRLVHLLVQALQVECIIEDIGAILESAGCYQRRDDAIRTQVPEYGAGYRCKLVLSDAEGQKGFEFFHLVVESPDGTQKKVRLEPGTYLAIVAATNMKQRARKFYEYYHADRLNFAVAGTPNRLEYDQGFFVKNGDGAADLKPIAHLYKSQVYQIAEYLGIPEQIRRRTPTTDTYTLPQTQAEFYFSVPHEQMDLCLYGLNHGVPAEEVAKVAGLEPPQVERVYSQIASKRKSTRYQQLRPLLIEAVKGPYEE